MNRVTEKVTNRTIHSQTNRAKDHAKYILEKAERFSLDPDKKERMSRCLCKTCFYINNTRMGGARITSKPCGICETDMQFSSTATDKLCSTCATEHDLCKQCGGDIDMIQKRTPRNLKQ